MGERGVVLVVDDDHEWRELVSLVVGWAGYDVRTASDGLEGLRALRRTGERPAAIVLDLSMPRLSGWEFRAAQLRDPSVKDIPVVVVSGDELGPLPAERYLRKPCSPDALLDALESLPLRAAA